MAQKKIKNEQRYNSIKLSYYIGLPVGTAIIGLFALFIIYADQGAQIKFFKEIFLKSIIALYIAFVISLYFAGRRIFHNLNTNNSVLATSYNVSQYVIMLCWFVFTVTFILDNLRDFTIGILIFPIIGCIISIILCTFTIGLIIVSTIKSKYFKITQINPELIDDSF